MAAFALNRLNTKCLAALCWHDEVLKRKLATAAKRVGESAVDLRVCIALCRGQCFVLKGAPTLF